ncbi:MAG: hypothetical protein KDB14_30085, partial [Planctomycetales bacterium]|nr:hypothetical protein [Planctomycetales bacterium]
MARTTLIYPKIPGSNAAPLAQCIAFEKYDGTNLHWAWDCELGWHAFGTRRDRFDLDAYGIKEFAGAHPELESAARLFRQSLEGPLTAVLRDQNCFNSSQIVAFTEFLGASSFAGRHREAEEKRLVLFDIQTEQGMLAPDLFVEHLDALPIARTVYRGRLTGKFATDVREG